MEFLGCFFCLVSGIEEKLSIFMSEILFVYDFLFEEEFVLSVINVGDVCCVQFFEDNQWYRVVVEDNINGVLIVRFIDYGNIEILLISRIKILKDVFFVEFFLVVKCSFFGIKFIVSEIWFDEFVIFFEEFIFEKEFDVKFSFVIELFEIQLSESGVDIGEKLVRVKLVVLI